MSKEQLPETIVYSDLLHDEFSVMEIHSDPIDENYRYIRDKGFFGKLKSGLEKTRNGFVKSMDSVFHGFSSIDEDFYEELEEYSFAPDYYDIMEYSIKAYNEGKIKNYYGNREYVENIIN